MNKILLLFGSMVLFSGCMAVDSMGVKGLPHRGGFHAGTHYTYQREEDPLTNTLYTDIGYTYFKKSQEMNFKIDTSISNNDNSFSRVGTAFGWGIFTLGYDYFQNEN